MASVINTSKLQISELDFDAIMLAFQNFLSNQSEFSDYNFEGAGMRVLLRLLAYNTHYLSYYLNMIANEMYLESADRRDSIVSIAKQLGYTPRSRKAAQAIVNITVTPTLTPTPPATLTINKGTQFNASLDGKNFIFVTREAITMNYDSGNNRYRALNVSVYEGIPYTFKFVVDTNQQQRFVIPNAGVDTSSIVVRVQDSSMSGALTTYVPASDFDLLDGNSTVYFLQEVEEGKYEVYFGDGILGKSLEDGNIVYVDYLNTNGDVANYCNFFTAAQHIGSYSNIVVQTLTPAFGGAEREDKESIRFAAPKNYEAQDRAVTVQDYKTLIARDYPNVDSVAVWGGENMVPAQYGKVFLSLKPVSGYVITELTKQTIVSEILKRRNVVSIIPVVIDPEYIFVTVDSLVKYDAQATTLTADDIKAAVISTIQTFADTEIGKFDRVLRYSKLTRNIDTTNPAITNNLTTIKMQKRFTPRLNVTDQYTLLFSNAIVPGSLTSTAFVDTLDPSYVSGDQYFFEDDGNGTIKTYKFVGIVKKYVKLTAGTIDYTTGKITLTNFRPQDVVDASKELRLTVKPVTFDIAPVRNNIVVIEDADITVNMQANSPVLV